MHNTVKVMAAAAVLLPLLCLGAEYDDGLIAFAKRDYDTARSLLLQSAGRGHWYSQRQLGEIAIVGYGRAPDPDEALGWYLAAQQNGAPDMESLIGATRLLAAGNFQVKGQQITLEFGHAAVVENWLDDAADPAIQSCQEENKAANPGGPSPRWSDAYIQIKEFDRNAVLQDSHVVFRFPAGESKLDDTMFIADLMRNSAAEATPHNCRKTSYLMSTGFIPGHRAVDPEMLAETLAQSANGNTRAQFTIAMIASINHTDYNKTHRTIEVAAQGGDPDAQYLMSKFAKDPAKQRRWLELSAQGEVHAAQIELAELMLVEPDKQQHVEQIRSLLLGAGTSNDEYVLTRLVAILAAAPDQEYRSPERAAQIVKELHPDKWRFPIRYEAVALVYASQGRFDKATSAQQQAISHAKEMHRDVQKMEDRLHLYQAKQAWSGYLASEL